jgi:hypothetical protein
MRTDEKTLRHILDLARADINRSQPFLALEHLRTIRSQIDDLSGTPLWAEYQLSYAEAVSAMNEDAAEREFEEALSRLSMLEDRDLTLELRAYEHLAQFLCRKHRPSPARKYYQLAENVAVDAGLREDADRIRLCVIRIDLETSNDPQLASFQNLKKAAEDGYCHHHQLTAWIQYSTQVKEAERGLLNARQRGTASVDYFRGLLSSIRNNADELEN